MIRGLGRLVVAGLVPVVTLAVGGTVDRRVAQPASAAAAEAPPCTPAPLEERAALPLVVGLASAKDANHPTVVEVLDVGVGGVLLGAGNVQSSDQVARLVADVKARAARPIVIATGDESGRVSTFRDVLGPTPTARSLATRSTTAVRSEARRFGTELAALGITLALAPVLDLDRGPAGALIGDRSFSGDPDIAGRYGLAWAEGLAAAGLHETAKHFPGHGRTREDSHLALPRVSVSLAQLRASELQPFATLIRAGVPVVMVGHLAYSGVDASLPASVSPRAYRLLRQMGFEGVAMTDSLTMGGVTQQFPAAEAAVRALQAGADAVLTDDGASPRVLRDALVEAVRSRRLPEARLNEAAARMVALAGGDPRPITCRRAHLPQVKAAADPEPT